MASKLRGERSKKYSRLAKLYESQSSWIPEKIREFLHFLDEFKKKIWRKVAELKNHSKMLQFSSFFL